MGAWDITMKVAIRKSVAASPSSSALFVEGVTIMSVNCATRDVNIAGDWRRRCFVYLAISVLLLAGICVIPGCKKERRPTPLEVLHAAVAKGNPSEVRQLLDRATVNSQDEDGFTALHVAAFTGQEEIARMLLDAGADPNIPETTGSRALDLATSKGHFDVVKLLVERGAALDGCDETGRTALHVAAERGDIEVVRLLIAAGAAPDARTNLGATTPLHEAAYNNKLEVVRELLHRGVDVDARHSEGRTALVSAAGQGHWDVVREILQRKPDVTLSDEQGYTALHEAVQYEAPVELIQRLLELGAKVDCRNEDGLSPLDLAERANPSRWRDEVLATLKAVGRSRQ